MKAQLVLGLCLGLLVCEVVSTGGCSTTANVTPNDGASGDAVGRRCGLSGDPACPSDLACVAGFGLAQSGVAGTCVPICNTGNPAVLGQPCDTVGETYSCYAGSGGYPGSVYVCSCADGPPRTFSCPR